MPRKRYSPEQIIAKLREIEIEVSRGKTTAQAVRTSGISEQTYYRWKKRYGGMGKAQAKRLKELEKENARLKLVVADQALDNAILKEALKGNS
jgi:transposase